MQIQQARNFPAEYPKFRCRRAPVKQDNVLIYGVFPVSKGHFSGAETIYSLMAAEIQAMRSRRALMRLVPVRAASGLDDERHRELAMRLAGGFHDRLDDPCRVVGLGFRHLEQQLVMDL